MTNKVINIIIEDYLIIYAYKIEAFYVLHNKEGQAYINLDLKVGSYWIDDENYNENNYFKKIAK